MSAPALTPVVVRLKLSLLRNGLRQSGGRRAAWIASAVIALLFAALQMLGLVALRGVDGAESPAALIVFRRTGSRFFRCASASATRALSAIVMLQRPVFLS